MDQIVTTDVITDEERREIQRLVRTGKSLEYKNAELLVRLQEAAKDRIDALEAEGKPVEGNALRDILAISETTTKFTKAIREDDSIREKLAKKVERKRKGNPFDDLGLNEARALMTALSRRFSNEQILELLPVTIEQQ